MKVAFLHIEPQPAKVDANRILIESLIVAAAERGASWIVTPELCIPGYYFADVIDSDWIKAQPDEWMQKILDLSSRLDLVIFLSCPERDESTGKCHNSLFAIDKGTIAGNYRKIEVHPGAEESWSFPGTTLEPTTIEGTKVGMLICADTWESKHGVVLSDKAADLLVVSTAWGHKYSPLEHWKTLSVDTSLPVWVCNRTGIERNVDWTKAESMVIKNSQRLFSYYGEPAILLFDWDINSMQPISKALDVFPITSKYYPEGRHA